MAGVLRAVLLLAASWATLAQDARGYGATGYAVGGNYVAPAPAPQAALPPAMGPTMSRPEVVSNAVDAVRGAASRRHQQVKNALNSATSWFTGNAPATAQRFENQYAENLGAFNPTSIPGSHDCTWTADPRCKFPFVYKGSYYSHCIPNDLIQVDKERRWCSSDYTYRGDWQHCIPHCQTEQNNGNVIAASVGGVAAAAAVAGIVAVVVKETEKDNGRRRRRRRRKDEEEESTSIAMAPKIAMAPNALNIGMTVTPAPGGVAPRIVQNVGQPAVPVLTGSYSIPVTAPQAKYEAGEGKEAAPGLAGAASYFSGPAAAFFCVIALFTLSAFVATLQRRKRRAQMTNRDVTVVSDSEVDPAGVTAEVDDPEARLLLEM